MIKAKLNGKDGEPPLFLLGLDAGNVKRLQEGHPILVNLRDLDGPRVKVAIDYGETLQALIAKLREMGLELPDMPEHEAAGRLALALGGFEHDRLRLRLRRRPGLGVLLRPPLVRPAKSGGAGDMRRRPRRTGLPEARRAAAGDDDGAALGAGGRRDQRADRGRGRLMPLEPTEEQLETVVASVFDGGDWSVANEYERAEAFATARAYWPLIRDMVLEAAERECETSDTLAEAAARIRALKAMAAAKTARNAADIVASEVPALVHEALEDAEGER